MENQLVVREVATARDALQVSKCSSFAQFLRWDGRQYVHVSVNEIWRWARSKGQDEVRKRLGSMKLLVELHMPWRQ